MGVYLGAGESFNHSYTIMGVSGEYCVVDNLAVGAMYRTWFGGGPTQNELSLYSNYFFALQSNMRPYVGAFVRRTFISSELIDDFNSYGFRGGLSVITSQNSYISFGYAVEYYDTCVYLDQCKRTYPELTVGISF